jgi:hypothetical protein
VPFRASSKQPTDDHAVAFENDQVNSAPELEERANIQDVTLSLAKIDQISGKPLAEEKKDRL